MGSPTSLWNQPWPEPFANVPFRGLTVTVSKAFLKRDCEAWQGGEELLDDLLRALPSDWVMKKR